MGGPNVTETKNRTRYETTLPDKDFSSRIHLDTIKSNLLDNPLDKELILPQWPPKTTLDEKPKFSLQIPTVFKLQDVKSFESKYRLLTETTFDIKGKWQLTLYSESVKDLNNPYSFLAAPYQKEGIIFRYKISDSVSIGPELGVWHYMQPWKDRFETNTSLFVGFGVTFKIDKNPLCALFGVACFD